MAPYQTPLPRTLRLVLAALAVCAGLLALWATAYAQGPDLPATPVPANPSLAIPPDQVLTGVIPDLPSGYMIIEGDIQVPIVEFQQRFSQFESAGKDATPEGTFETNLWPNGNVRYEFNSNVTATNRTLAQQAMNDWENARQVQVTFTQCANNNCTGAGIADYVHIQNSTVNNSAIGRRGGRQIINIVSWNWEFIIAHELGHALGLEHEQNRPDRNTFVTINSANICKATDTTCTGGFCLDNGGNRIDCDFNFAIVAGSHTFGSYDFDSVMHYGRDAFSRNGNDTITVLPPNNATWQNVIGQRAYLSTSDEEVMECMYPPAGWRYLSTTGTAAGDGACGSPFRQFPTAASSTPSGGTLWIELGSYAAVGTYNRPMTIRVPHGLVTLGQ